MFCSFHGIVSLFCLLAGAISPIYSLSHTKWCHRHKSIFQRQTRSQRQSVYLGRRSTPVYQQSPHPSVMFWDSQVIRFCFPPNGLYVLLQQLLPVTTSEQISVQSHDISWVRPLWLPDRQMLLLFTVTHPCILVELHFYCPPLHTELDFSYDHWTTKATGTWAAIPLYLELNSQFKKNKQTTKVLETPASTFRDREKNKSESWTN